MADRRGGCRRLFGRILRARLAVSGRPRKEHAWALGVATSTLSQWMSGKRFPRDADLDALASHLKVGLCCLFCPALLPAMGGTCAEDNPPPDR